MTDSAWNEEAREHSARLFPADDRGRTETYPLDALRAHKAASWVHGAQWQRSRLLDDDAVEVAAQRLYELNYHTMTGYSWSLATETVRNEYRATALGALSSVVNREETIL